MLVPEPGIPNRRQGSLVAPCRGRLEVDRRVEFLDRLERWVAGAHPEDVLGEPGSPPTDPVVLAWTKAVLMRPLPPRPQILDGYRRALAAGAFAPELRPVAEVARRISHLALCSHAVKALRAGDLALHRRCVEHPGFLGEGPTWLEHPEAHLLYAVANGGRLELGVIVQLSWRDQAAWTLAWAAGWTDLDPSSSDEEPEDLLAWLPASDGEFHRRVATTRFRPLDELRDRLARALVEVETTPTPSEHHSALVERIKALRWLTEPWWPELALTPWRDEIGFQHATTPGRFVDTLRSVLRGRG